MRGRRRRRGAQRRSGVRGLRRRGRPPSRAPTLSAYPLRAPAVVAMAALGRGRPPPLPPQSAAPPCSSHRPRDAPAILCAHGALAMSRVSQSSAAVKQRSWRAAPGSPARRSPLRAAPRERKARRRVAPQVAGPLWVARVIAPRAVEHHRAGRVHARAPRWLAAVLRVRVLEGVQRLNAMVGRVARVHSAARRRPADAGASRGGGGGGGGRG